VKIKEETLKTFVIITSENSASAQQSTYNKAELSCDPLPKEKDGRGVESENSSSIDWYYRYGNRSLVSCASFG
jgi:hypothetical protein